MDQRDQGRDTGVFYTFALTDKIIHNKRYQYNNDTSTLNHKREKMIIIDPHLGLAYVKHTGPICAEEFVDMVVNIASHPYYAPGIRVLIDYQDADFNGTHPRDIKVICEYLMLQRKNLYHRAAIVLNPADGLIVKKLWQTDASPLAHEQRAFYSMFQGESWLFNDACEASKKKYQQVRQHSEKIKKECFHHLISREGTILTSTVTAPLDGCNLPGKNIADILHSSYLYPFMCMLRMVLKTQKQAWINVRIRQHDYANHISPAERHRAMITVYAISDMGDYEVERLKWPGNTTPPPFFPPQITMDLHGSAQWKPNGEKSLEGV